MLFVLFVLFVEKNRNPCLYSLGIWKREKS